MVVMLREQCLKQGPITHAVCQYYKCEPEPYLSSDGLMIGDGVHAVDTLRWMCGGEVERIESITKRLGVPDINFVAALLRFDNGCVGILAGNWSSGRRIFRVEMHAPRICADAEHEGMGYVYADGDIKGVAYDTRQVAGSDEFHVYNGCRAKNREFIDCLKAGTQPGSNFADAVKTMEVTERILAAALLAR